MKFPALFFAWFWLFAFSFSFSCTHVESGQPQVVTPNAAPVDPDDIASLVKPKLSDFNSCYKEEQKQNPRAAGKVLFSFTVTSNGRTEGVRLLASTLKSPVMEGCLVGKMEAWIFPAPKDGQPIQIRYPFAFQP